MVFLDLRLILGLFFSVTFIYFAYEARSFPYLAKIFPLSFSIFMVCVSIIYLFKEVRRVLHKKGVEKQGYTDIEVSYDGLTVMEVWKRFSFNMGMFLALYACIWIFGYVPAIFMLIVLYYRFINKTNIWWSVFAGFCGIGFVLRHRQSTFLGMAFRHMEYIIKAATQYI